MRVQKPCKFNPMQNVTLVVLLSVISGDTTHCNFWHTAAKCVSPGSECASTTVQWYVPQSTQQQQQKEGEECWETEGLSIKMVIAIPSKNVTALKLI